jgi:Cu(I)/Ag(I) efflux system membrane fusion protein
MDLVSKISGDNEVSNGLNTLLKPTNEYVVSSIPVMVAQHRDEPMEIKAIGYTAYNTSAAGTISARVSGRIERLYLKYRYQPVAKGQKLMDIYSPELVTAQEHLLYVLKNDAANVNLIASARQRLLLLGMSSAHLDHMIATGRPSLTIPVFSSYSGHLHESGNTAQPMSASSTKSGMEGEAPAALNPGLRLREGMYVQKGQQLFQIYDPYRLWALLTLPEADQAYVKQGDNVSIITEGNTDKPIKAKVTFIEPGYREGNRTITIRVNIAVTHQKMPIGSQVSASIYTKRHSGWWLPKEAVASLGINKIVFVKRGDGFAVQKVSLGHAHPNWIQITDGLDAHDSVATNAQYLMDSESFIRINAD